MRENSEQIYRLREMAELIGIDPDKVDYHQWMMKEMQMAIEEARKYFAEGELEKFLQWVEYYRSIQESFNCCIDVLVEHAEQMLGWK